MCYNLPHSLCRKRIIGSADILFIACCVCFLPIAILLRLVAVYTVELHSFNLAINRHNKIAIGRKKTRLIAINKVSTDAIINFLHSESAANHDTCLNGEKF